MCSDSNDFGDNTVLKKAFIIALATLCYGFVLGWWRSPLMAVYVGCKLPVVFLGTALITSGFFWMAAIATGVNLGWRETLDSALTTLATAGSILLALVPVVFMMILTGAPDSGSRNEMRFAHSILMTTHITVFSVAGLVGLRQVAARLRTRAENQSNLSMMLALWLVSFSIVGCQLGWIMRPLVGSPNICVELFREDALDGNFFESCFTQIGPHLINKGAIK